MAYMSMFPMCLFFWCCCLEWIIIIVDNALHMCIYIFKHKMAFRPSDMFGGL